MPEPVHELVTQPPPRSRGQPGQPQQPLSWRQIGRGLRHLGPGLITGAADDDPSGIGTYAQAGAAYGPGLLWLTLWVLPLMIAVQEMCGRIGVITGQGLAGIIKQRYSRPILFIMIGLLLIANTINIGADLGAMAASARLLMPAVPFAPLVIAFAIVIVLVEVYVPYQQYARVLRFLSLALLAYVITGIVIHPQWGLLLVQTLIPSIHFTPQFLALIVAFLGTTISPYLFFWQASEEVEEQEAKVQETNKRQRRDSSQQPLRPKTPKTSNTRRTPNASSKRRIARQQLKGVRLDTTLGMLASEITSWFIIMTASSTLHAHGITTIQSADQAAAALKPLAGPFAEAIFALGIVGTGLLAIPVLAGSAAYGVSESLGWNEGLAQPARNARGFYGVIAASTLIGMALNFIGVNPIAALVYTAIINGFVAVPLLIVILLIANNRAIMGEQTNSKLSNTVNIIATACMGVAAIVTIVSLL